MGGWLNGGGYVENSYKGLHRLNIIRCDLFSPPTLFIHY